MARTEIDRSHLRGSSSPVADASLVLRWEAEGVSRRNCGVEVALMDGQRRRVGGTDRLLLSDERQPTSSWEARQEETDYYAVSGLPETALGEYSIEVLVYDP